MIKTRYGKKRKKKANPKRKKNDSLLIAAQNNAIRTNNIGAKINKVQQNSNFRLCGERDGTVTYIKSETSNLAQKNKIRLTWVGKITNGNQARY